MVLAGSYISAMVVGLFAWGTATGTALLGFAALAHSASVADAIRQSAFPGFGPWAPWCSAAVGLGGVGYAPALVLAMQVAYPAWTPEGGYLINRSAFEGRGPEVGHWVWLERERPGRARGVALVVAAGGQRVSWADGEVFVDGKGATVPTDSIDGNGRSRGAFEVPDGALLVFRPGDGGIDPDPEQVADGLLEVVAADRVIGRAWARHFPIWERRLLA
jgi:hypothetical protein